MSLRLASRLKPLHRSLANSRLQLHWRLGPQWVRCMTSAKHTVPPDMSGKQSDNAGAKATVPFKDLLFTLRHEKVPMGVATIGILGASLASMAIPDAVGTIIDALNNLPKEEASSVITGEMTRMLAIFSGGAVATFVKVSQIETIGQRVSADFRKGLFKSVIVQETGFFDKNKSGELANRLSTDVHEVAEHLVYNLSISTTASITAAVAGVYMLHISPTLTAITFAVVPAMAVGGTWYGRRVRQLSQDFLAALAKSTQMAIERFSQILIVKSYNGEARAIKKYSDVIDNSFGLAKRLATAEGSYLSVIFMTSSVSLLAVLWFGGQMVMVGDITVGALASFGMYAYQLGESVSEITEGVAGTLRAQGSAGRLFHLLQRKSAEVQPPVTFVLSDSTAPGPVVFEDVKFAYPSRPSKTVLHGIDLVLEPGKHVGVTGTSGCGKSTIGLLLQKLYPATGGNITISGRDISSLNTQWWRDQISYVSQDSMLFSGTIAENIGYSSPHATDEQIEKAAKDSYAHDFIIGLPDGYNTVLGERGVALSGGQRQRLTIARALLTDPKIIILDEATSALDLENERLVQTSLKRLMQGRTSLVISHHPLILQDTDRVIVLDKGKVVQDGAFTDLVQDSEGQLLNLLDYPDYELPESGGQA